MKKIIAVLLVIMLAAGLSTGCGEQKDNQKAEATESVTEKPAEPVEVRVGALKGPTAMGMVELMNESDEQNTETNEYTFTIAASADEIVPSVVKGDIDLAAVPANLAAVLNKNTEGAVEVIAVNTLGVLYIVENGDSIKSIEDLKGKTIYSAGKGSTPEYALNYCLKSNGIDPVEDVTIEYKSEHAECVAAIMADTNAVAMLPQPFATSASLQNQSIQIALDLNDIWNTNNKDGALITGVVVARKDFCENHPEAVELFLEQYKESVDFVNENNEEASTLIEKYGIIAAAVAKKALPYCNIVCITGEEMKTKLSAYLNVLYEQDATAVGGVLPSEDFYYTK